MKFRKHSILLAEYEFYTFMLTILCVYINEILRFSGLLVIACLVLMAIYPLLFNEYITISEAGVCCIKRKETIWSFSWDEISELRKSRRFRHSSIEILPSDIPDQKNGLHEYYFQLGSTAKSALQKYCKLLRYDI